VTETGPFFIETSGSGDLSFRQACAVESLALHNPNLTVYVLFVNVKINSSVSTLNVLKKEYENIRLIKHQSGRLDELG
jgi:lactosylceramide 4-alpha-galactosyltransferase